MKNIHSTIFLKIFGIITANLLLCDSSQAQDLADFILRNVQKADIIVEGFVESTESFYDNNGEIYTLNYLNCEQVFKEERIGDVGIAIKTMGGDCWSYLPNLFPYTKPYKWRKRVVLFNQRQKWHLPTFTRK